MRLRKYPVLILDSGFAAGSIEIHFLFNSFILFSLNNGAIYWGLRAVITFKRGSVHWQWAALTIVLIIPQKKNIYSPHCVIHPQLNMWSPRDDETIVPAFFTARGRRFPPREYPSSLSTDLKILWTSLRYSYSIFVIREWLRKDIN